MSKYLLDTCVIVSLFRANREIANKLNTIGLENCAISEITLAELIVGAESSSRKSLNMSLIEKFERQIAIIPFSNVIRRYAREKVATRKAGTPIEDFDLIIGCTALDNDMILVTDNVKHMKYVPNLIIENWHTH